MPGTGPTDSGGGRVGPEGGQDPAPDSPSGSEPDGSSEMPSSDGPQNSGPRTWYVDGGTHNMVSYANNNNSAPDNIDDDRFRGGPDQC